MVEVDFVKIMGINPETMSEQEKDDIYETVAWYDPSINLDKNNLIHFVRLAQEVLKFKAEQVEYLTSELDDIAARQGKEEGSKLNRYIDEIEQLKHELEYRRKLDQSSSKNGNSTVEELKRELMKLEVQNSEILDELKEKEKDLMKEKDEVERYAGKLATLEREKQELSRELKALHDEEKSSRSVRDSPELGVEKQEELIEIIRQKNKHISQLLEDVEVIEKENQSLRSTLTNVRDELSETTTHMTEITSELSKLKHLNKEYKSQNVDLDKKVEGLLCQIEELVEEKKKNDKYLDEYILNFNVKLEELNMVINAKDEEIVKLRDEIKKIYSSNNAFAMADVEDGKISLSNKILHQEEQIKILQEELQKATVEITCSTKLIEQLKEKHIHLMSAPVQSQSVVTLYEEKVKALEEKVKYAEEDAQAKAEQMSELVIQVREYEKGVFGLPEAIEKIKKLERSKQKKECQIEKLVEMCNGLEMKLSILEEQNICLQDRLGLSATDEMDTSEVKSKMQRDEENLANLKLQLEKKEEELIKAKLKYRKVIKVLKMSAPVENVRSSEKKENEECENRNEKLDSKLQCVIKENDALRKGMHEILESIHKQDCSGTVEVQSTCLERLLEALDSRHVSGWYHPAMRLQAQLNAAEGKNEELRNQIRFLKTEEKKKASELQNAYLKIQSLEMDATATYYVEEKAKESQIESQSRSESESQIESQRPEVEMEGEMIDSSSIRYQKRISELQSDLSKLKLELDTEKTEMEKLKIQTLEEKETLESKISELDCQVNEFKRVNHEVDVSRIPELTSRIVVLERRINFIENLKTVFRERTEKLRSELLEKEKKMVCEVLKLQNDKLNLLHEMENLEETILNMVKREKFESVRKELTSVRAKYQRAAGMILATDDEEDRKKMEEKSVLFCNERETILEELKLTKEKLIVAEAMVEGNADEEMKILAGKLAASETRETNEQLKSSHLEKLNEILKSQLEEIEFRNGELLKQVSRLTEENGKLEEAERNLRMKIVGQVTEGDVRELHDEIRNLRKKCADLNLEKDNVQELFEISQGQCRALQEWKDEDKILLGSLSEQVSILQSSGDDKATISRLSYELAAAKMLTVELSKENNDLKMNLTKLQAENVNLGTKVDEKTVEVINVKKRNSAVVEHLVESIDEVRKLYGGTVYFEQLENVFRTKLQLKEKKIIVEKKMKELEIQAKEHYIKKEEMEMQLECLEDLKSACRGETKKLICWHNKSTEMRLKEMRTRRENEFLKGEVSQLEGCVNKLNEELAVLEEGCVEKEKQWERKQMLWEEGKLEMCRLLRDGGDSKKSEKTRDASTNTNGNDRDVIVDALKRKEQERMKIFEWRMQELEAEVNKLRREEEEKEEIILLERKFLNDLNEKSKSKELEESPRKEKGENAEKEALRLTVQSLENIIAQKEETILRYQELLKEGREEYSRSCAKLQEEFRGLNETLVAQSKAYNKLKNAVQANHFGNENIPFVVEKYIVKIQELEEELKECQMNLSSVNTQAFTNQQEVEKWRNLATERLLLMEDMRQRLETEYKNEMKQYKEDIKAREKEIEDLNEIVASYQAGVTEGEVDGGGTLIPQLQEKEQEGENDLIHPKSDHLSDCTFDKPSKQKNGLASRTVEILKRQLKFSRDESTRLREQIRLLKSQTQKRPKTGSSTGRSESKSSVKEENLMEKIKNLEESLAMSKERETDLIEINKKKLKSVEEVARWNEKKKNQQTIETLTSKIKEKEAEVEMLKSKNESFRNMIYKCERDKTVLETQLKVAKGGPTGNNARIEKLTLEKSQLEADVEYLRNQLENQKRHSGGRAAVLLQEKLEVQERKLATFELASKGQTPLVEELERVKMINSNLEKSNLKLESENLTLGLKLEKEKTNAKYLTDKIKQLHKYQEAEENNREKIEESDRIIISLRKTIGRLTEENKRLKEAQKNCRSYSTVEKVKQELDRLKEDHKNLRIKYTEATQRNISLEEDVKNCRYQINLMEEKDLAEALTKTSNFQATTELTHELMEAKAKLAHKTHLLNRVKTLLIKAAAKEKALHQEVTFLQGMVPKSSLQAH